MLGPEERAALIERSTEQSISAWKIAEFLIDAAQCFVKLRLDRRLLIEISRLLNAAVHECDNAQTIGGADILAPALKKIERELLDALRTSSLGQRDVTRVPELQRVKRDKTDDSGERRTGDNQRTPISPGEFAESISGAVSAGFERLVPQEVIDVAHQRLNGAVTSLGILVHCREAKDVEVRPLAPRNRAHVTGAVAHVLHAARRCRRPFGLSIEHHLFRLRRTVVPQIEREASDQELV